MARVFYATPTGKHPHCGYHLSVVDLLMTSEVMRADKWRSGAFAYVAGPVQMARSAITMAFRDSDADYLLMHDDDLSVNPFGKYGNPIDVWVKHMDESPGVGVVGACYLRESPRVPLINFWHPAYPQTATDRGEMVSAVCNLPHGIFDCAAVGTGFMMISRAAAVAVLNREGGNAGPPFCFPVGPNRWGGVVETGEDFHFCNTVERLGFRVQADTRFPTCHIKESGKLTYEHEAWQAMRDMTLDADKRARVVVVDGVTCIDVSQVRIEDARERGLVVNDFAPTVFGNGHDHLYDANMGD